MLVARFLILTRLDYPTLLILFYAVFGYRYDYYEFIDLTMHR